MQHTTFKPSPAEEAERKLRKITDKKNNEPSLLEKALQEKDFLKLNKYYQHAENYFKDGNSDKINATKIFDAGHHCWTILFFAIACAKGPSVITDLLNNGSKTEETYFDDSYTSISVFYSALRLENYKAMRTLLNHNHLLALQKINISGVTPAHYAAEHDNPKMLEELYKISQVITRIPSHASLLTPLHIAAILGKPLAAKWLLDHDKEACDLFDDAGYTPLHHAVMQNHLGVVKLLLENGADPTLASKPHSKESNKTPLQLAVLAGHNEIAPLLMQHHAIPDLQHPVEMSKPLSPLIRLHKAKSTNQTPSTTPTSSPKNGGAR